MIEERIKTIRQNKGYTQAELARKLNITRSSINAWELGISTPSTQYIIELANLFNVSTDYLLNVDDREKNIVNIDGLSDKEVKIIKELVEYFKTKC